MAAVGAHRHRGEAQEAEQDPEQTHGRQSRRVASESSPAGLSRDPFLPPALLLRLRGEQQGVAGTTAGFGGLGRLGLGDRSEEHTSELQSLMRISYALFCLKKKNQ